ncbi:hypothetical protein WN55_06001 [Dufourea novaeangliae]|uniref:Uncharacterized protein n=1 Tax=Dufourea novaeangliae TaxID=178035 RepID=A0A154NZ81_DUFNO|nr:hypothetical protein WN55_06001 [Dufourea novaeangliae]
MHGAQATDSTHTRGHISADFVHVKSIILHHMYLMTIARNQRHVNGNLCVSHR